MTEKPNILLITADDMNWDAVGAYGCPVTGTTPNIDLLADQGICFNHAHVTIAVCQPSRSVLMTGQYPHHTGGEGFFHLRTKGVPVLPDLLRPAGYKVGIIGKVEHSTPYGEFRWDMMYDREDLGQGRNPAVYAQYVSAFIQEARESGQPFFLMTNSHDPHRPFYGNDKPEWYDEGTVPKAAVPSRTFSPEEITVPGFLADLPDIRLEISEYYNSVRRCDDTAGAVLNCLKQVGCADNTIVVFLSDNGMAFPFSKTNCYLHSTKTPWIMRWPKVITSGQCDNEHFISGIDLMPTLLDAAGVDLPQNMDGQSFLQILQGKKQNNRDLVYTQFHQTAGRRNYPMRCVQNSRFGYIFNPWSNGTRVFKNESQSGRTMEAMQNAAQSDPCIAERVQLFLYRVPEEFYDFEKDPDALCNLIDDPRYADEIQILQEEMEQWMEKVEDPAIEAFRDRYSPESLGSFMEKTRVSLGGE